jgi:hypothetical protein
MVITIRDLHPEDLRHLYCSDPRFWSEVITTICRRNRLHAPPFATRSRHPDQSFRPQHTTPDEER